MLPKQRLGLIARIDYPGSECSIVSGVGRRCCSAMVSVDMTGPAGMVGALDLPMTLREYSSSTTARYN
jgi:hypothetical protein